MVLANVWTGLQEKADADKDEEVRNQKVALNLQAREPQRIIGDPYTKRPGAAAYLTVKVSAT